MQKINKKQYEDKWCYINSRKLLTQRDLKVSQQSQEQPWCLKSVGNPVAY